jgi:acetyl-CoA C-acetyltransferase
MAGSVIVAGARTPMGRLLGGLKDFSAADLGGVAIKGALAKAGVAPEQVEYVIMGQVLQAGAGQIPARQAAVKGGIPMSVPALTINKV